MKETKKGFVEIPKITLNALKGLLFSDKGTDLSPIIEDLGGDDLTAINVALVFKRVKPNYDGPKVKFGREFRTIYRYEYVQNSLILGNITVRKTPIRLERDNQTFSEEAPVMAALYFEDWESMPDSDEKFREEILRDKR